MTKKCYGFVMHGSKIQPIVYNYLKKRKLSGKCSSFTIAGAAIGVTATKFKSGIKLFGKFKYIYKIHKIEKLIVINHKDCEQQK